MERCPRDPSQNRGVWGRVSAKVLIGIAAAVVATIAWLQWPTNDASLGLTHDADASGRSAMEIGEDPVRDQLVARSREVAAQPFSALSEKSRIVVVDEEGNAIAGAKVVAGATRFRAIPGAECHMVGESTEDGVVQFELAKWPAERAILSVHHPNYVSACAERPLTAGELRITLARGHTFTFDCRAQGLPLAGVTIRVSQGVLRSSDRGDWASAPPELSSVCGVAGKLSVYGAVSDEHGKAVIRGLPTGTYGVHAWKRGFVQIEPQIDFGAPAEIVIKVEMLEPIVYAIEYDGNDVLGAKWARLSVKPVTKPMPECARLERELMARFPNSTCMVLPIPLTAATQKLKVHILHARGCNAVEVEGVRLSELSVPIRESFGTASKPGLTGSVEFDFTLRDGTVIELEYFALRFQVARTDPKRQSLPVSISVETSPVPQQLPIGRYTVGAPPGGEFAFLGRHVFDIQPGETTKVRVHITRVVRPVRIEPDFVEGIVDVPCHLQILSSTDPSSVIPGLPTTILASVGSDLTLKGLASGYEGTEVKIKITEGVRPLLVKLPMRESP